MKRKLTDEQVQELRKIYSESRITQDELARRFGISQGAVSRILHGLAYAPDRREQLYRSGPKRKLTPEQVQKCRLDLRYKHKYTILDWADELKVSPTTIMNIKTLRAYADVPLSEAELAAKAYDKGLAEFLEIYRLEHVREAAASRNTPTPTPGSTPPPSGPVDSGTGPAFGGTDT